MYSDDVQGAFDLKGDLIGVKHRGIRFLGETGQNSQNTRAGNLAELIDTRGVKLT